MKVLVLGASLDGVRAAIAAARTGHETLLCTPQHYPGEDVLCSWAYRPQARQEALKTLLSGIYAAEDLRPLAVKRGLDAALCRAGVQTLYVTRPAAITQYGGQATGALLEDGQGLRYVRADLVLDGSCYGEYTAMTEKDGLIVPRGAVMTVRCEYIGAQTAKGLGDIAFAPCTMEAGHVQASRGVVLERETTLGGLRARWMEETARLCDEIAQSGVLGAAAALYPAFPQLPEVSGMARPQSPLRGLMYAAEYLRAPVALHAPQIPGAAMSRGMTLPFSEKEGRVQVDFSAMTALKTPLAVVGGGTAGVCAALGAAEHRTRPLVLERGAYAGGTRTLGGMRGLYYGNRSALFARLFGRLNADAARLRQVRNSATETLSVAAQLAEAGAEMRCCASLCAAQVEARRVKRMLLATEEGLLCVQADAVIDATGAAQAALLCGCETAYGDGTHGRTQNYSQWRICPHDKAEYAHCDQGMLDDPSAEGLTAQLRHCMQDDMAYDLHDMLTVRESRRLKGRAYLTLRDVMRGETPRDTIYHAYSTHDPHGRCLSLPGRLGIMPALGKARYVPVPYGTLLPREVDNLLVCGKALSMDQESFNYIRMAPDIMCVGYLAGWIAAQCLQSGRALPDAELSRVRREMRRAGGIQRVAKYDCQEIAQRIACGEEDAFADAVLTDDRHVYRALLRLKEAGCVSKPVLCEKTLLWFGDRRGEARLLQEALRQAETLQKHPYCDRQGKTGVIKAGIVGETEPFWLLMQLCVLLARAGSPLAHTAIMAALEGARVEDEWRNDSSAYASIRLDCQTPAGYDRALSLACACALLPRREYAAELERLSVMTRAALTAKAQPWQEYLLLELERARALCLKA